MSDVALKKYTVLFDDGFMGGANLPDPPTSDNQCASIKEAGEMFRRWMIDSGNDYSRSEGYGQPCAYVYLTAEYDGIAYGDYPYAAFDRGPRGGIHSVSL